MIHGTINHGTMIEKYYLNLCLGCRFHGCSCLSNPTAKQIKAAEMTEVRRIRLINGGYNVIVMRECVWDQTIKQPEVMETPTRMASILKTDTEETLLDLIRHDKIFGYARCTVISPQSMIDRFKRVSPSWYHSTWLYLLNPAFMVPLALTAFMVPLPRTGFMVPLFPKFVYSNQTSNSIMVPYIMVIFA